MGHCLLSYSAWINTLLVSCAANGSLASGIVGALLKCLKYPICPFLQASINSWCQMSVICMWHQEDVEARECRGEMFVCECCIEKWRLYCATCCCITTMDCCTQQIPFTVKLVANWQMNSIPRVFAVKFVGLHSLLIVKALYWITITQHALSLCELQGIRLRLSLHEVKIKSSVVFSKSFCLWRFWGLGLRDLSFPGYR